MNLEVSFIANLQEKKQSLFQKEMHQMVDLSSSIIIDFRRVVVPNSPTHFKKSHGRQIG